MDKNVRIHVRNETKISNLHSQTRWLTIPSLSNGEIFSSRQRLDRRQNDKCYYEVDKFLLAELRVKLKSSQRAHDQVWFRENLCHLIVTTFWAMSANDLGIYKPPSLKWGVIVTSMFYELVKRSDTILPVYIELTKAGNYGDNFNPIRSSDESKTMLAVC